MSDLWVVTWVSTMVHYPVADAELWAAGVRGAPHRRGQWMGAHFLGDDDASVDNVVSMYA